MPDPALSAWLACLLPLCAGPLQQAPSLVEQVTSVKETKRCFLRLRSFWAEPVELVLFLAFSELAWER